MSALHFEAFEAFRSIDSPEDKARRAAAVLSRRGDAVSGLDRDVSGVNGGLSTLKADVATVKADTTTLKSDMAVTKWTMGFVRAIQVLISGKMFIH